MEMLVSRRSALAAAALLAASLPAWRLALATALAEEPAGEGYVALGDSISTGYGLDEEAGEAPFASLLAKKYGYDLELLAQDGETTVGLAEQLEDPAVLESIAGASLITVTIGGNDLMQGLYTYLADAYNEENPGSDLTAEDVMEALETGDTAILTFALGVVSGFATSDEALEALAQFNTGFPQALGAIRAANPDAKVVVATQYNPYAHLGGGAAALGLDGLATAFETGLGVLNKAIAAACEQFDCSVADVYAKFQEAEENPCNASFSFTGDVNLDFHPNVYGHTLIAEAFEAAISGVDPEEPDSDAAFEGAEGVAPTADDAAVGKGDADGEDEEGAAEEAAKKAAAK